jgi:hypothetical protein
LFDLPAWPGHLHPLFRCGLLPGSDNHLIRHVGWIFPTAPEQQVVAKVCFLLNLQAP